MNKKPRKNTFLTLTYFGSVLLVIIGLVSIIAQQRHKDTQTSVYNLPAPKEMVSLSKPHSYPVLKGLRLNPDNPFNIEFILDLKDKKEITETETKKLINYFLAGLTIPDENMWVNLSPYEKNRIIPEKLAETDLGKDLLGQDYILKQLMSTLTYPESKTGKNYWQETYQEIAKINGNANIPIDTFNKVWITPGKSLLYEKDTAVLVLEAELETMLEEDYFALKDNKSTKAKVKTNDKIHRVASQIMKKIILPKINQDVNNGENFSKVRQIYYSLILSTWFKEKFKQSFFKYYIDREKITGIDITDKNAREKIYNLYVEAFKKGLYDYIKKDYDPGTRKHLNRRYYSGGCNMSSPAIKKSQEKTDDYNSAEKNLQSSSLRKINTQIKDSKASSTVFNTYDDFVKAITNTEANGGISRVEGGITVFKPEEKTIDQFDREISPDSRFFTNDNKPTQELLNYIKTLDEKETQENIATGIMYYDIRSTHWNKNPAFTVIYAFEFAQILREQTGQNDGIVLHLGTDAYTRHTEAARIFIDAIRRTGICANGGGIYFWGLTDNGSMRNYPQAYHEIHGKGGEAIYFTISHLADTDPDALRRGAKMAVLAQAFCGEKLRHIEGVTKGKSLWQRIIEHKHFKPQEPTGWIVNIKNTLKHDAKVAANVIRNGISNPKLKQIEDSKLLDGVNIDINVAHNPLTLKAVKLYRALGAKVKTINDEVSPDLNPKDITDPNEHNKGNIPLIRKEIGESNASEEDLTLVFDPDNDRITALCKALNSIFGDGAYSFHGFELQMLVLESIAKAAKARNLPVTILGDTRAFLAIDDYARALSQTGYPITAREAEAGYTFFMLLQAELGSVLASEDTTHSFIPINHKFWTGKDTHKVLPNQKGYPGGDNAALFGAYFLASRHYDWMHKNPVKQLEFLRQEYSLKPVVSVETKPKLSEAHDKYKYVLVPIMKGIMAEWFSDNNLVETEEKVCGIILRDLVTRGNVTTRHSNSASNFTNPGTGYVSETEVAPMQAIHETMITLGSLILMEAKKRAEATINEKIQLSLADAEEYYKKGFLPAFVRDCPKMKEAISEHGMQDRILPHTNSSSMKTAATREDNAHGGISLEGIKSEFAAGSSSSPVNFDFSEDIDTIPTGLKIQRIEISPFDSLENFLRISGEITN